MQKSNVTSKAWYLWRMCASIGNSKSLELLGFSSDHRTQCLSQASITSQANRANSTPTRSFSRALVTCLMYCLARLKTAQGTPRWTTLTHPALIQLKMASCVARRLRSWWVPRVMSIDGATAFPRLWTAAVNRPVPLKISRNIPGFTRKSEFED